MAAPDYNRRRLLRAAGGLGGDESRRPRAGSAGGVPTGYTTGFTTQALRQRLRLAARRATAAERDVANGRGLGGRRGAASFLRPAAVHPAGPPAGHASRCQPAPAPRVGG